MQLDSLKPGAEFRLLDNKNDTFKVKKIVDMGKYKFVVASTTSNKGEDVYFHHDTKVSGVTRLETLANGQKFVYKDRWHKVDKYDYIRCVDLGSSKQILLTPDTEVIV